MKDFDKDLKKIRLEDGTEISVSVVVRRDELLVLKILTRPKKKPTPAAFWANATKRQNHQLQSLGRRPSHNSGAPIV